MVLSTFSIPEKMYAQPILRFSHDFPGFSHLRADSC
jgi:hypothetical protein